MTSLYLPATERYAGDDWVDTSDLLNALRYVVWATPPVLNADGSIATAGVAQNLTGWTVVGSFYYQSLCAGAAPASAAVVAATGTIVDPVGGVISLSLLAAQTAFVRQSPKLWGNPDRYLLIAQPRVVDPTGKMATAGLQQVGVF